MTKTEALSVYEKSCYFMESYSIFNASSDKRHILPKYILQVYSRTKFLKQNRKEESKFNFKSD